MRSLFPFFLSKGVNPAPWTCACREARVGYVGDGLSGRPGSTFSRPLGLWEPWVTQPWAG